MPILDFSFNNPRIRNYFEGSDEYVPVEELLYVHSHPLVRPNFLAQIESILNLTAEHIIEKSMKGKPINKFVQLTENLGKLLPGISKENSAEVLKVLREIYSHCGKVTGKR